MTDKVVDASAVAAILFNEAKQATIFAQLGSSNLFAPDLIDYELANVCLKKIRAQPADRDAILQMHATYTRLAVTNMPVDIIAVRDLAEKHSLTAYDASYLWLARALRIELVTLDSRLMRAAKA